MNTNRYILLLLLVLSLATTSVSHARLPNFPPDYIMVRLTSTNLPIVWITVEGRTIDRNERITATMKIIHNGDGQLNYADTVAYPNQHVDYEGYVALRYRGGSSFDNSPKKPYSFRPLDKPLEEGGTKKKVDILGMGKDNNWALIAPYADKSLIRDLLAFEISRPWMEYTPEGRLCELFLDGTYYGVYVLSEVVSKGKTRLNLDDPGESGDELTGGYLMSVERNDEPVYTSKYYPRTSYGKELTYRHIYFQYKEPDYEDLTAAQMQYIQYAIDRMESSLAANNYANPTTGYRQWLDVQSFIDFQLAQELGHNVDAYRLSGKFFKRRDSEDKRFKMVVWDMNLAYGNADYYNAWRTDLWSYQANDVMYAKGEGFLIPFWWYKLNKDDAYVSQLKARWAQYRRNNVRDDRLMATVDSLANVLTAQGAVSRNSSAWPRWGTYVWPNYYVATSFQDEINHLKQWLLDRVKWMDSQLGYDPTQERYGDVNGDGEVTIADVNLIIEVILGHPVDSEFRSRADVNGDGEVTIGDINAVVNVILGL